MAIVSIWIARFHAGFQSLQFRSGLVRWLPWQTEKKKRRPVQIVVFRACFDEI
jgi:hypothetical protein